MELIPANALLPAGTYYREARIRQLDVRVTRNFRHGNVRFQPQIDLYNLFNFESGDGDDDAVRRRVGERDVRAEPAHGEVRGKYELLMDGGSAFARCRCSAEPAPRAEAGCRGAIVNPRRGPG